MFTKSTEGNVLSVLGEDGYVQEMHERTAWYLY